MNKGHLLITMSFNIAIIFIAQNAFARCHVADKDIQGEYIGDCKNRLAEGYGIAIGKDSYEGYFHKGEIHGKGKYTWANRGDMYEGNWVNGKANGEGTYTWSNGSSYQGHWENNIKDGYGKLTIIKGDKGINSWEVANKGYWQNDVYIVQGIFENGDLVIECSSPQKCQHKMQTNSFYDLFF